jgi:tetratricopeptide (TPR) repeat protein
MFKNICFYLSVCLLISETLYPLFAMDAQHYECDHNSIPQKKRRYEEEDNTAEVKRRKTLSQKTTNITPFFSFSELPGDIIHHILNHMDDGTLARFSITAKSLALISLTNLTEEEFKERSPLKTPLILSFPNGQSFKHSYFLRNGFWNVLENLENTDLLNNLKKTFNLFKFSQYCLYNQFIVGHFIKFLIKKDIYEDIAKEDLKTFHRELSNSFLSQNPIGLEVELAFKCKKVSYGFKYTDESYIKILLDISGYLIDKGLDEVNYHYTKCIDSSIHLILGNHFYQKINITFAKKYYKLAAKQGQVQAQYNLGCIYDQESNLDEAKKYYKLAVEQGQVQAQYNLGCIYDQESNLDEAKKYYKLAAEQGDANAQRVLLERVAGLCSAGYNQPFDLT